MKKKVIIVLIIALFALAAFSLYKIFSYFHEGRVDAEIIDEAKGEYYSQDLSSDKSNKFTRLWEINEDIIGWLRVDGTKIDYPVVQKSNNDFYLRRNLKKEYALRGSIFMDYTSSKKAEDFHTVIYGHNMKDGSMFGNLAKFKQKDFFLTNRLVEYDYPGGESQWEIFSVYIYKIDDDFFKFDFESEEDFEEYVKECGARSIHKLDQEEIKADRMLTLMSCTYEYNNSRLVVHAIPKL